MLTPAEQGVVFLLDIDNTLLDTINTLPEKTLLAFAEHGSARRAMAEDGGDAEPVLQRLAQAGIDTDALAARLQHEGTAAFVKSWRQLLERIADKAQALSGTAP